ncbi:MAG: hypothetical protein AABW50_00730 [Nanoarchaeota archaeon]
MKKGSIRISNKAQVTIFVIIAIVIIAAIVIFLIFQGNRGPGTGGQVETSPESFLDSCLKEDVRMAIEKVSLQGGYLDPEETVNTEFQFNNEQVGKIAYLCYTNSHYTSCINQRPGLLQHVESELYADLNSKIVDCFRSLEDSLNEQKYVVETAYHGEGVKILRKGIEINVDADMVLTKNNEVKKENEFKITVPSKLLDTVFLVQEIVSQEARFCNFNELGYMLLHPEWSIRPPKLLDDGTRIYSLENRKTKEEFRFAVKGCVT